MNLRAVIVDRHLTDGSLVFDVMLYEDRAGTEFEPIQFYCPSEKDAIALCGALSKHTINVSL